MSFYIDKYLLKKSPTQKLSGGAKEIRIDLNLEQNPDINTGSLTGTITDHNGEVVSGAIIKVLTKQYDPVAHGESNLQGQYVIGNLQPGSYNAMAVKGIYLRSNVAGVSIAAKKQTTLNLVLPKPPFDPPLAVVWGRVLDSENGPIEKATVNAYQLIDGGEAIFAETLTNSTGQYFVNGLPDGQYVFRAVAPGYKVSADQIITIVDGNNLESNFVLAIHPDENKGTVNGIISDEMGQPISALVFVGLYHLDEGGSETLVDVTKTNQDGLYLFGSVEPGTYLIKAKAIEQVN